MSLFQIALISIIVLSSIQFIQYVTIITAYFLLLNNTRIHYLKLKFLLTSLIALQNIGMMLTNKHQNGQIINDATCTVQALIINGTELSLYTTILCILWIKCYKQLTENYIISITLITMSFLLVPLLMGQTKPAMILCEFDEPTKLILSTIYSYLILVLILISPLLTKNKFTHLNYYLIVFTLTQIIQVIKNSIDIQLLELIALFFIQVRNFTFMLIFQIESREAYCGYCRIPKKQKKLNQQQSNQEERIPVKEQEMMYKI